MNIDIQSIIREILREEIRAALVGVNSNIVTEEKASTKGKVQLHSKPSKTGLEAPIRNTRTAILMNIQAGGNKVISLKREKNFDKELSRWVKSAYRCNRVYGTQFKYRSSRYTKEVMIYRVA